MVQPRVFPPDLLDAVQGWAQQGGEEWPASWESMQLERDARIHDADASPARDLWRKALDQIQAHHPGLASTLRLRYEAKESIRFIGQRLHRSPASVHRDVQAGLRQLASLLWQWESQARQRFIAVQSQRLEPPTYDQLFGVQPLAQHLKELVQSTSGPDIILLFGAGGLGKTSLADSLSRSLIADRAFDSFGWISLRPQISLWDERPYFQPPAPQQTLEAIFEALTRQLLGENALPAPFSLARTQERLTQHLRRIPHFIVIDNLETLAEIAPLLAEIRQMAGPTRFLITSRVGLPGHPHLYHQQTPPLSQAAAIALLRHQGRTRHVLALNQARDEDLIRIHQKVGGNPLALKLVAGQLHVHALSTVLDDLTLARGRSATRLYDFIYRRAWDDLDEAARRVLLAMPLLPPDGGAAGQITAITGLADVIVHDALETLVQRNLVDHRPGVDGSLYAIHGLTRTFLQQQIV